MPLNDDQRLCAEGFGASLAVIAGAGSGKTFTLKERIANAFDPAIVAGRMEPVTSIDEVMAITFTERAALELKGRVRSTLKSRGLTEQALLVDTAWISTIHGMCARILRENALELGIDPAFEVVADERREAFLGEAIEEVFQATPALAHEVSALFAEYSLSTLKEMVSKLVDVAASSPEGFASLEGPVPSHEDMEAYDALAHAIGQGRLASPAEMVDFVDAYGPSGNREHEDGTALSWEAPWGAGEYSARQKVARTNRIALELRLIAAARLWEPLLRVAKATALRFAAIKREQGVLDNNDLLVLCAQALRREGVRSRYENRFRLVMVDEFQDTDQVQLDIICVLAGPDCERLCVVGDPQQSIYRFRGADLSVCEGHLATIPPTPERQIHLDTNYRSHPDILDFVDVVFGAPREETLDDAAPEPAATGFYQKLVAGRDEDRVSPSKRFKENEGPRIEVVDAEYPTRGIKGARSFVAAHIARRFNAIHKANDRPWSHMVILLGKMTNAQVYADALDELGIPCAITGGSVLAERADTKVMLSLVRVLANPRDDEALVSVLTSDIFGLSADDLLEVRMLTEARRLGAGFMRLLDNVVREDDPVPLRDSRLEHAVKVILHATRRAAHDGVARALELALVESGWLSRREAEASVSATSRAADALKIVRMIEDIEAQGTAGSRQVAEALSARLEIAKEAPGVLQAERGDFVRIMTIHASKGLQFPIVAAAELEQGAGHAGKLTTQTTHGRTLVSLDLEHTVKGTEGRLASCAQGGLRDTLVASVCDKAHAARPLDDATLRRVLAHDSASGLAARDALIRAFGQDQDALELERKIYVAFTRAEEALIACILSSAGSAAIDERIAALPEDELGAKEALRISKSSSKKITLEQKAEAKEQLERFRKHLCLSFVGAPKGMCWRIRSRRDVIEACGYTYLHAPTSYVSRWERTRELPPNWIQKMNQEGRFVEFDDVLPPPKMPAVEPLSELPRARVLPRAHAVRFAPQGGYGLLSASAMHAAEKDAQPELAPLEFTFAEDDGVVAEASPTERGSAFHLMGEVAARRWQAGASLRMPEDRLAPTARLFGLSPRQEEQLGREMHVWLASDVAREMAAHAYLEPEAPFAVALPAREGCPQLALTGFIDLLAFNERGRGTARVVDYKTGYSLTNDADRRKAYETQARCYAYALMCMGFSEVTLDFVFVDQPDASGMPALCSFPAPGEGPWTLEELGECFVREVGRLNP